MKLTERQKIPTLIVWRVLEEKTKFIRIRHRHPKRFLRQIPVYYVQALQNVPDIKVLLDNLDTTSLSLLFVQRSRLDQSKFTFHGLFWTNGNLTFLVILVAGSIGFTTIMLPLPTITWAKSAFSTGLVHPGRALQAPQQRTKLRTVEGIALRLFTIDSTNRYIHWKKKYCFPLVRHDT